MFLPLQIVYVVNIYITIHSNGSLNVHWYITEILIPHVQPALCVTSTTAVFVDDNSRAHREGEVVSYLTEKGIRRLAWTARSPDLNRIEAHVRHSKTYWCCTSTPT